MHINTKSEHASAAHPRPPGATAASPMHALTLIEQRAPTAMGAGTCGERGANQRQQQRRPAGHRLHPLSSQIITYTCVMLYITHIPTQ